MTPPRTPAIRSAGTRHPTAVALCCGALLAALIACATPTLLERAERGDVDAQIELGDQLRGSASTGSQDSVSPAPPDADASPGPSPEPDPEGARLWYRRAAEQGDARAGLKLAELYYYAGEGVAVDYAESAKWARMAAEQGYTPAQSFLAGLYRLGAGVPRNNEESIRWYRAAAEQGDPTAQYFLGAAYDFGAGVEADSKEALRWYELAADQGHELAQLNAGALYLQPRHRDDARAFKWLLLAAAQGNRKAYDIVQELLKGMTPEQVVEADALIGEWRRAHEPE